MLHDFPPREAMHQQTYRWLRMYACALIPFLSQHSIFNRKVRDLNRRKMMVCGMEFSLNLEVGLMVGVEFGE
jgi:hypothetical protein